MTQLTLQEYRYILSHEYMSFAERAFRELNPETRFVPGMHIELMASKLEDCRLGTLTRLIVNLPPRSLKSHLISVAFVAWYLGHYPDRKVICVSYSQDLSEKLARDTRNLMTSAFYQRLFPTRIAPQRTAVADFETTAGGGRMATSVGGTLTGRGADIHHCMRLVGLAERMLERMCRRADTRKSFGKVLSEQTVTLERIAQSRILIEQARLLTLKAAWSMDNFGNKSAAAEIAMIKVAAPEMACRVIDWAIQAFGAAGLTNDYGLGAGYATARFLRIADGPDEVHRNQIARLELQRHRSPNASRSGGDAGVMTREAAARIGDAARQRFLASSDVRSVVTDLEL